MPEPKGNHYEPELAMFFDAMRYKLRKNQHKGRWEDLTAERALELLKAEVAELEESIASGNRIETLLECADVANFAMILAHISVTRLNQRLGLPEMDVSTSGDLAKGFRRLMDQETGKTRLVPLADD